jgi:hypothetical protein
LKIYLKKNLLFFFTLLIYISAYDPLHANNKNISIWFNNKTDQSLIKNNYETTSLKNVFGASFLKNYNHLNLNLSFILDEEKRLMHDNSYIDYTFKNSIFGIGKIDRHWSFSPKSSLFISNNARPASSVYFKIKKKRTNKLIYKIFPSSFEIFNAINKNKVGPQNQMMLGARAIFKPKQNLSIELIKISQWGGHGYSSNINSFFKAAIGDSNEGSNKNVNQVAGVGFSYTLNGKKEPLSIYGQILGEDEAGNLPSCLMYLYGAHWNNPNVNLFKSIGLEITDTRIDFSTNNNCGPNTGYNNTIYKYTNYDSVIGVPIDSEGKSINLWSSFRLSQHIDFHYSLSNLIINDANYNKHRLSSSRQEGWENSLNIIWEKPNKKVGVEFKHTNIKLDKKELNKNFTFGIFSELKF